MGFKYKVKMRDVVERHKNLWGKTYGNKILVKIDIDDMKTLDQHMNLVLYSPDYKKMYSLYDDFYRKRKDIYDDSIPVARASFGSAALSHYFGGEVEFTPGGAFTRPLIKDIKKFDIKKLEFNKDNFWIKKQIEMVKFFSMKSEGLFPVCVTEVLMGLVWAEYLLGENVYYYIYDEPGLLSVLLEKSVEFNIRYIEEQRKYISPYKNGIFEMFEVWLPGNQIWNSIDTYGNCDINVYKKFGKTFIEEIGKHFGGQWMHMHSNAIHLFKEVANTKYISGISIMDDLNAPRGFEMLDEIMKDSNGIPIQVFCNKEELLLGIENNNLKNNVYYWCSEGVKTIDEANMIMERVYDYSN
jgi:hypothetical protein